MVELSAPDVLPFPHKNFLNFFLKSFLPSHRLVTKEENGSITEEETELHRQHFCISRSIATLIIHERFYPELAEVELKPRDE